MAREAHALQARWQTVEPLLLLRDAITAHETLFASLVTQRSVSASWFRRLAQEFPRAIRLTHLTVDATRRVRMTGEAQGREQTPEAQVSALVLWLDQAKICQKVELESSRSMGEGGDLVEFSVVCDEIR